MPKKSAYIKIVNEVAASCIQKLFSKSFTIAQSSKKESAPSFKGPFISQIALRNKEFEINIFLGIDIISAKDTFSEILNMASSEAESSELVQSSLGELTNTVACDVASQPQIIDDFGKLLPTHPLVWVITPNERPEFHHGDGISSQLEMGKTKIFTHFSATKFSKDLADAGNWRPTKSLAIFDPHQR